MKDQKCKNWKRRQKCIRPNIALFWNQNISCWSLDRAKTDRRRREEKKKKKERREEGREKKSRGMECYGFVWNFCKD